MWVLKFQFNGEDIFFGSLAKKFGVEIIGYPISSYNQKNKLYLNLVGTIKGSEKEESKIIKFLKKSKYFTKFESNKTFFNLLINEDKKFSYFYSPFFVYLSPVKIDLNGRYSYHLGSWNKEELSKLLEKVEKYSNFKLLKFKKERIETVSILGVEPNLTKKQKDAYEVAVKNGYYEYPKKIELRELAKISGISYSTFQQHLKYAEKKISEFFVKR